MNHRALAVLTAAALAGCGEKAQEARNAANAIQALAQAGNTAVDAQKDAEKFYADRREKGDTVAIPYTELQKLLPSAPSGYSAAEEPSGSSQSMGAFSMSQAEQKYVMPADAEGNTPTIEVTLMDLGGTQAAYGMMALPMMMNISQEDAHHRMRSLKMDAAHTWGSEEYNKDNKDAKVTVVTRYRYAITVEARNQKDDQSAMVKDLAESIAKQFDGK